MAQNLSNLPIGAKIKFGKYSVNGETAQDIIWLIVAKNHSSTPAYPTNSITLLTEKIIDLRCFDAAEPNSTDTRRKDWGNNRYAVSNIDQWLNKDSVAGAWYSKQHNTDQAPNSSTYVMAGTEYSNRPGFLNAFTTDEKDAVLSTTIRVVKPNADGAGYEDISRKVFLPSLAEVGLGSENNIAEGTTWSYFLSGSRSTYLTSQAHDNSLSMYKPNPKDSVWYWLVRTPNYSVSNRPRVVGGDGSIGTQEANAGGTGVRPALNLSSTLMISNTTDGDGCYTVVLSSAPPAPSTLNVSTVYGGKSTTITWGSVTDPDGEAVTYQLEQSIDGGAYTNIYTGSNLAYTTIVPFSTTSVQFRVKAISKTNVSSEYKTSSSIPVINNNAPVISGSDSSLGIKIDGFTQTYSVTDANNNVVTITEAIDGVKIRSYVATLGETNTFSITGNTWLALANGIHTMTITATDGLDNAVRTYTFTKALTSFTVQKTTAIEATTIPTRIKVSVMKTIPAEATFKVEVCNNGFDSNPTWEDATSVVLSELTYEFMNTTKTATKWGVNIRVTVMRNNGSGACYITSIGGNFE